MLPLQQGQLHQGRIIQPEQRRAQRACQRQVMRGRHQYVEQSDDVLHLAGVNQAGFFADLGRNVQSPQRFLQGQQASAFARQDHDLARRQAGLQLLGNPGGGLARL